MDRDMLKKIRDIDPTVADILLEYEDIEKYLSDYAKSQIEVEIGCMPIGVTSSSQVTFNYSSPTGVNSPKEST